MIGESEGTHAMIAHVSQRTEVISIRTHVQARELRHGQRQLHDPEQQSR